MASKLTPKKINYQETIKEISPEVTDKESQALVLTGAYVLDTSMKGASKKDIADNLIQFVKTAREKPSDIYGQYIKQITDLKINELEVFMKYSSEYNIPVIELMQKLYSDFYIMINTVLTIKKADIEKIIKDAVNNSSLLSKTSKDWDWMFILHMVILFILLLLLLYLIYYYSSY